MSEAPPSGNYPTGSYHCATSAGKKFFSVEEKELHERILTEKHMPFLIGMLYDCLNHGINSQESVNEDDPSEAANMPEADLDEEEITGEMMGVAYEQHRDSQFRLRHCAFRVSSPCPLAVAFLHEGGH